MEGSNIRNVNFCGQGWWEDRVGRFQGSKTHILMWGAGLGRPPIMGEGLNSLGQGKIGRGVVVAHQDGGMGVQVASGTSSRSMRVEERCMAWLWEGCQG